MFSFQLVTMVLMFTREQPIPPSPLPERPRASAPHVLLPEPTWRPLLAGLLPLHGRWEEPAGRGAERGHGGRRAGEEAAGPVAQGGAHRAVFPSG